MEFRCVVIGGGISGLTVAAALAARGIEPVVLEAGQRVGAESGGTRPSGQSTPDWGGWWAYLGRAAVDHWGSTSGFGDHVRRRDTIHLALKDHPHHSYDLIAARAGRHNPHVHELLPTEAAQQWNGLVKDPSSIVAARLDNRDRGLVPSLYLKDWENLVRSLGGTIMLGAEVTGARLDPGRRKRVVTLASGEEISCDGVVNAAGCWANDVAKLAETPSPRIRPARGGSFVSTLADGMVLPWEAPMIVTDFHWPGHLNPLLGAYLVPAGSAQVVTQVLGSDGADLEITAGSSQFDEGKLALTYRSFDRFFTEGPNADIDRPYQLKTALGSPDIQAQVRPLGVGPKFSPVVGPAGERMWVLAGLGHLGMQHSPIFGMLLAGEIAHTLTGHDAPLPDSVMACAERLGISDLHGLYRRFSMGEQSAFMTENTRVNRAPARYGPGFSGPDRYEGFPPATHEQRLEIFFKRADLAAENSADPAGFWFELLHSSPLTTDLEGWKRGPYDLDLDMPNPTFYTRLFTHALVWCQRRPPHAESLFQRLRDNTESMATRLRLERGARPYDPIRGSIQYITRTEEVHAGLLIWVLNQLDSTRLASLTTLELNGVLSDLTGSLPPPIEAVRRRVEAERNDSRRPPSVAMVMSRYERYTQLDLEGSFREWLRRPEGNETDGEFTKLRSRKYWLMNIGLRIAKDGRELPVEVLEHFGTLRARDGVDARSGIEAFLRHARSPQEFLAQLTEVDESGERFRLAVSDTTFEVGSALKAYSAWHEAHLARGRSELMTIAAPPAASPLFKVRPMVKMPEGEFRYDSLPELLDDFSEFLSWPLPQEMPAEAIRKVAADLQRHEVSVRRPGSEDRVLATVVDQALVKDSAGWTVGDVYQFQDPITFDSDLAGATVTIVRRADHWALQLDAPADGSMLHHEATGAEQYSRYLRKPQALRPGQAARLYYWPAVTSVARAGLRTVQKRDEDVLLGAAEIAVDHEPVATHLAHLFGADVDETQAALESTASSGGPTTMVCEQATITFQPPEHSAQLVLVDAMRKLSRLRTPAVCVDVHITGDRQRWYQKLLSLDVDATHRLGLHNGYLSIDGSTTAPTVTSGPGTQPRHYMGRAHWPRRPRIIGQ